MRRLTILAACEASTSTPRDGTVDPKKAPAGPCWNCITPLAPDSEALSVPFFSERGASARCAAQLVVVHNLFGSRIQWAAVSQEHCYRFRPVVSVESCTQCDPMDVITSAVYGFTGVSRAGSAMRHLGSTPKSRTVVKELKTSSPALRLFFAFSGCGTARCIRTHRPLRHRASDTSCGRSARA